MSLIVRLTTSAGVSRLTLSSSATLGDLMAAVEHTSGVPPTTQVLSTDRQGKSRLDTHHPVAKLVTDLSFENGQQVFLQGKDATLKSIPSKPAAAAGATESSKLRNDTSALTTNGIKGNKADSSSASVAAAGDKTEKRTDSDQEGTKNPKHKTFEAFLRERRYDTGGLALTESFQPSYVDKGRQLKLPPPVTLHHQVVVVCAQRYRHVDQLTFMNALEMQKFVSHWMADLHLMTQRAGWMYGYYVQDPNYDEGYRAVLEGIYEPPQQNVSTGSDGKMSAVILENDPFLASADAIMGAMGLERIGQVFTAQPPREELLTAEEVVRAARMQQTHMTREGAPTHYSGYPTPKLVTCVVSVKPQDDISATPEPETRVYMVSDQGQAMIRDQLILPPQESDTGRDSKRLQIRKAEKHELVPTILQSGKNAVEIDPEWFLVNIVDGAPKRPLSVFEFTDYPRENRPTVVRSPETVAKAVNMRSNIPDSESYRRYSDFHLLLHIGELLGADMAGQIAKCVADRTPVDPEHHAVVSTLVNF